MIVAFNGNDGSGKTTLAERFFQDLQRQGVAAAYRREFEYFILSFLQKRLGGKTVGGVQSDLQDKGSKSLMKRLLPYAIWLDLFLERVWYGLFFSRTVVVKDRSALDFLMTWREQGVSNGAIEFFYTLFLKPDLTFYVRTDAHIAYGRRREQEGKTPKDLDFYVTKTADYDAYVNRFPHWMIDNNGELDVAFQEILRVFSLKQKLSRIRDVAVSGIDGAGKTTTINNFKVVLTKLNIRYSVIHFYYNYLVLKIVRWVVPAKQKTDEEKYRASLKTEKTHRATGKPWFWKWFVLGDAYIQYGLMKFGRPCSLHIFDRFFQDYLVSFRFLGVAFNKEKLGKMFPFPDRYFLQVAAPEVLFARKPEHTMEFFETCYQEYMDIARKGRMIVLDSTMKDEKQILSDMLNAF